MSGPLHDLMLLRIAQYFGAVLTVYTDIVRIVLVLWAVVLVGCLNTSYNVSHFSFKNFITLFLPYFTSLFILITIT